MVRLNPEVDKIYLTFISDVDVIRFVSKIRYVDSGCWEFDGTPVGTFRQYRQFRVGGRSILAHRLSYHFFTKDKLWVGSHIDHLCRNTTCVNPAHLEQVSARENILRGKNHVAERAISDTCIHGHILRGTRTNGDRYCMTCKNKSQKKYKLRVGRKH